MSIERTMKGIGSILREFAQEVREDTLHEVEATLRERVAGVLHSTKLGKPGRKLKAIKPKVIKANHKASPARKLQGRYMGMLRRYKGREKGRIMGIAKQGGVAAAIAEMEKLNGRTSAPKTRKTQAAKPKAAKKATAKARDAETRRLAKVLAETSKAVRTVAPITKPAKLEVPQEA